MSLGALALLPWFLSLLQLCDQWCDPEGRGQPMLVTHQTCGQSLQAQVRCDHCDGKLLAHQVRFTLGDGDLPLSSAVYGEASATARRRSV